VTFSRIFGYRLYLPGINPSPRRIGNLKNRRKIFADVHSQDFAAHRHCDVMYIAVHCQFALFILVVNFLLGIGNRPMFYFVFSKVFVDFSWVPPSIVSNRMQQIHIKLFHWFFEIQCAHGPLFSNQRTSYRNVEYKPIWRFRNGKTKIAKTRQQYLGSYGANALILRPYLPPNGWR
jgi:hypothetical protein